MPNYVPGIGNGCARIAVVGEAPGGQEDAAGIPFVGPSGRILDEMLEEAGIDRDEIWLTNVCKYRPPQNDLKRLPEIGIDLEDEKRRLYNELLEVKPNVILALGATALEALTGKTQIRSFRGSIMQSKIGIKVVPALHPATLLYGETAGGEAEAAINYGVAKVCLRNDIARAKTESFDPELILPNRQLRIVKDALSLYRFFDQNKDGKFLSVDIEALKCIPYCIGFAFNDYEAISVPILATKYLKIEQHQIVLIWQELAQILKSYKIVGQNFKFDQGSLRRACGFEIDNFYADTMLMASVLGPEMPKSLAFLTSIYTREPYYKDEGKEFNLKRDKIDQLLLYNAKDAVVTWEIATEQIKELEETGLSNFYFNFVHRLHDLYYRIERRGILRDEVALKELKEKYNKEYDETEEHLGNILGHKINPDSPKQVKKLLFETLKLPQRKDTSADTIVSLLNNTAKKPQQKEVLIDILKLRRIGKLIGTYLEAKTDEDNRMRTGYKITGTETGRTSTSILKPPVRYEKRGIAFQTMSKHGEVGNDLRRIFIPDPGYVFVEADLSQAEARVVAVLAKDDDMLRMFDETDIHKVTAGWVFQCPSELVTKEQRNIGKVTRHAGNYDAGKKELMRKAEMHAQKSGTALRISEWRAGQCLDIFHQKSPKIRKVFHAEVAEHLSMYRTLINPFGRARTFFGRYDRDLLKEGYAQIPQSTVSDQLKWAMLKCDDDWPESLWISRNIDGLWINLEAHDAFMTMVRHDEAKDVALLFKKHLEAPIDFSQCSLKRDVQLIIPCDIQIGNNWKEMQKYELAPTKLEPNAVNA